MGEVIIARNSGGASGGSSSGIDISSAIVTLASGTLTYDGTLKTQGITSVVVNGQTLIENTDYTVMNNAYTNAGNYTMTLTGMGNCKGTKNVSWSIAKAQGSLSVDSGSLLITSTAGTTGTVTVTKTGDGTIMATSGTSSVATASVSGTTVTVTAAGAGIVTITVTMTDGTNYLGDSDTFEVACVSSTLAENSPAVIQKVAQANAGSTYWSVGARTAAISFQNVTVGALSFNGLSACAFILGFDHNSGKEGNGIHFQIGKTASGTDIAFVDDNYNSSGTSAAFRINTGKTNAGGWASSYMRTAICPAFYSALPQAWQNVISTCTKYTDNTGGGSDTASYVSATNDNIWLLSEFEVHGAKSYANSAEKDYQAQYAYYSNGNSKVKYKHNATSTSCWWWVRSTYAPNSNAFCFVYNGGVADGYYADGSFGFAPCFKIA